MKTVLQIDDSHESNRKEFKYSVIVFAIAHLIVLCHPF